MSQRSRIKSRMDCVLSNINTANLSSRATGDGSIHDTPSSSQVEKPPGYLGEVSDVRFFNLVKRVLQAPDEMGRLPTQFDSYDQGDHMTSTDVVSQSTTEMLDLGRAEAYIEAYFSTIHLAYPFIPKSCFLGRFKQIRAQSTHQSHPNNTELALQCTSLQRLRPDRAPSVLTAESF